MLPENAKLKQNKLYIKAQKNLKSERKDSKALSEITDENSISDTDDNIYKPVKIVRDHENYNLGPKGEEFDPGRY